MSLREGTEAVSFGLILHSGNARSYGMEAISFAKSGEWDKAEECVEKGKEELLLAQKNTCRHDSKGSRRGQNRNVPVINAQ